MANSIGNISYVLFGKESSFPDPSLGAGSEPATTCDKFFWDAQSIDDSATNQIIKLYSIAGGRDATHFINGRWEGSLKVEAILTNTIEPWELILGGAPSGTTTKTVAPANELPSFALEIGFKDYTGNNTRAKWHGCKINSATLSFGKAGDPIKVSFDIKPQKVWLNSTFQTPSAPTVTPYSDFEAVLTRGSAFGVQDFNFTINNNLTADTDHRNRFVNNWIEGPRDYNWDFSVYHAGDTWDDAQFGQADSPINTPTVSTDSMTLVVTKGSKITTLTFPDSTVNEVAKPMQVDSNLVVQKVSGMSKAFTSVAVVI